MGNAQSGNERENEGAHHIYHGRYLDFEEGFEFFSLIYCHMGRIGNHVWKECRACAIGKKTRQDGVGKGDAHSGKEEFSGSVTDVGNGWRNETDDDERYHKAQKLAEDAVEGEKRSDGSFIEEIAEDYTNRMAMMILAKSGILILFIFVKLLFVCKGTIFLTFSKYFAVF